METICNDDLGILIMYLCMPRREREATVEIHLLCIDSYERHVSRSWRGSEQGGISESGNWRYSEGRFVVRTSSPILSGVDCESTLSRQLVMSILLSHTSTTT